MNTSQFLRLLFTAAIWGASHVFARIIVPAIGPEISVFSRILISILTLTLLLKMQGELFPARSRMKAQSKNFFIAGLLNIALPFTLFAFATVSLPASYLVILNATVPIFSGIFSSFFMNEAFGWKRWLSIFMGIGGVVLLTEYGSIIDFTPRMAMSLVAGLLASASYGAGVIYVRMKTKQMPPTVLVWGSNLTAAGMMVFLAVPAFMTHGEFHSGAHSWWEVGTAVFLLGAFSSGIAFVVYYKLVAEIGPFNASLTTFVMPMFGLVWGVLLLDETVTFGMIIGAVLVIGSAALFIQKTKALKS